MPVYVYKNLRTGETFEITQRISEPALTEHPKTGDPVKRLIQPVGIAFKGSGFYVTDSRRNGGAGAVSKARTESAGNGKSESSSESKVEAKGESKSSSTSTSAGSD